MRKMETKKSRKIKKSPVINIGQKRITNYYWSRKKRNGIDVETVKGNMETKRRRRKKRKGVDSMETLKRTKEKKTKKKKRHQTKP